MDDYNRGALKEPCLRLMTVDEALQKLRKENERLDGALEELRYKHSGLIDAVTDGLLSKECTPNEVVVQVMEERWQDKMYELEAENERLRQELATREESEQEKCIEYLRQENVDWEDKYRSVVRENAKLHDALKTIVAGVHHEICEGRVSHECEECSMSRSREGCVVTDAMEFFGDDEMCELLVAQTIERGSYE